jgi:photosystem II stability/assembly factor-like uncharacterized protein
MTMTRNSPAWTLIAGLLALATTTSMATAGLAQLADDAQATPGDPAALAWQPAPSPTAGPAADVGASEQALVVSTWREGTLRSTDGGHTWTRTQDPGVATADVAFDPTDPAKSYLAGNGGIARSTDAGETWETAVDAYLSRVMAVSSTGAVAASVQPSPGAPQHLVLSDDGGETWTTIETPYQGDAALEGLVFGPTEDHLVLADLGTTWVTTDAGETWIEQDTGARGLAAEPEGTIWRHGFGPFQRSTDGGQTWETIEDVPAVNAMTAHPEGGLYAATNEGVWLTRDAGQTWTDMGVGELSWQATGMVADPANPDAVFFTDETLGVNWIGPGERGGFTFEGRSEGFTPAPLRTVETAPRGDVLLAGGLLGLWASTDRGSSWQHTGAGIGLTGVDTAAATPAAETIYAGGSNWNGLAYVQVGGLDTATWDTTVLDGTNDGTVVDLETHPADPETAWAAVQLEFAPSKVYETRDGGETWDPVLQLGANPPLVTVGEAVHAIAYDEATASLLAATDVGVLAHQANGAWTPLSASPQAVTALAAHAGHVYADGTGAELWTNPQPGGPLTPWADPPAADELQPAPHGQHVWSLEHDESLHACAPTGAPARGSCTDATPPADPTAIAHDPGEGTLWAGSAGEGLYRAATR